MRATVSVSDLKNTLKRAKLVNRSRGFSDYLIEARRGAGIRVTAANEGVVVALRLPADVRNDGAAVVDRQVFGKLVTKLDKSRITAELWVDKDALIFDSGVRHTIPARPVDGWPTTGPHTISGESVRLATGLLKKVLQVASTDSSRPLLTGVVIRGNEVCATDSYRMAVARLQHALFGETAGIGELVIPREPLEAICKEAESVVITASPDVEWAMLRPETVRWPDEQWTVRLKQGKFPDCEKLVGDLWTPAPGIIIERPAFDDALTAVSVLIPDKTTPVRLFKADDGVKLMVTTGGSVSEAVVPGVWMAQAEMVAFNPFHLAGLLKVSGSSTLIAATAEHRPWALRDDDGQVAILYALMPVRV